MFDAILSQVRRGLAHAARGVLLALLALLCLIVALGFVTAAGYAALAETQGAVLAAIIVALVYALVGAVLAAAALSSARKRPPPPATGAGLPLSALVEAFVIGLGSARKMREKKDDRA